MSAKEWRKIVFSGEKKFNLDGPDCFQKYWHAKNFPEDIVIWGSSHFQENLKYNWSVVNKKRTADYLKMLNELFFAQEGRCLCGEEYIFQQDNAAILNASITKKCLVWFGGFYGISTFVGYLTPNPFLCE